MNDLRDFDPSTNEWTWVPNKSSGIHREKQIPSIFSPPWRCRVVSRVAQS